VRQDVPRDDRTPSDRNARREGQPPSRKSHRLRKSRRPRRSLDLHVRLGTPLTYRAFSQYDAGQIVRIVTCAGREDAMASHSLRGTRIGAHSMESDEGVELAERFEAYYDCPNGHTIVLPFSVQADVPVVWECRCGAEGLLRDASKPELKSGKRPRTHWDMLLERRTVGELEVLLSERLDLLRAGKLRRSA
jgi:hypothetical protein